MLDWGLAKDLGIPVQDDVSIGYWGHQCDGDEPSLSFGFILLQKFLNKLRHSHRAPLSAG